MTLWKAAQLIIIAGIIAGAYRHMVAETIFISLLLAATILVDLPQKEPNHEKR